MNSFRKSFSDPASQRAEGPTMPTKRPSGAMADELGSLLVTRDVRRATNHRDDDRHRLAEEKAKLVVGRKTHEVELINLSGGGAMVATDLALEMFQRVSLVLGECDGLDCAVLWIRDNRVGLEFAPETQIGAKRPERDRLLLDVLKRNFPGLKQAPAAPEPVAKAAATPEPDHRRHQQRHPMIWTGQIHFDHDSVEVRLRNISSEGALVDSAVVYPAGVEVLLDLGGAGEHFANVCWSRGDQVGLKFVKPFDLKQLAKEKPTVSANRWKAPEYLRGASQPDTAWEGMSLDELEGFLKR